MKFITITPTNHMKDALKTSDTTLVLAHLIEKDNDYTKKCKEFKETGGKLIMDNGFYELGGNMKIYDLADKAMIIDADILVLPDLPLRKNLKYIVESTIKKIKRYGVKSKLMMTVYPENNSFKEDLEQFKILNNIEGLDIIAIPYVFRENDEFRRPSFLERIENKIGVSEINKEVHLFGCNSLENLKKVKDKSWITSIDGTMPWKVGFYMFKLPISTYLEPRRPKHYFEINELNEKQRECIDYNLNYMKKLCENGRE